MMSCSSTLQLKSQVAFVALKELFVLYPSIPAFIHKHATIPARQLWPQGYLEYQQSALGFGNGCRNKESAVRSFGHKLLYNLNSPTKQHF